MDGNLVDPLYYRNPTGALALSIDEGESIFLPNGKQLMPIPKVWQEVDPAEEELTPPQQEALAKMRAFVPSDIDRMAWKLRKGSLAQARDYATPRVALRDPSTMKPDHDTIYRRLAARDALVVKSDPED